MCVGAGQVSFGEAGATPFPEVIQLRDALASEELRTSGGCATHRTTVNSTEDRSMAIRAIPSMLLLGSLALNWTQYATIARYKNALLDRVRAEQLAVGSEVPALSGLTLDGTPLSIPYGPGATAKPTLIYYFSPQCGWCKRNVASVNKLYDEVGATHRFIGVTSVSAASVRPFLAEQGHRFDVLVNVDAASLRAYRLAGTPKTVLVSPDGRVSAVWHGAYLGKVQLEIEQLFGASLPTVAN